MTQATPVGYAELHVGEYAFIVSHDCFRGMFGMIEHIAPDGDWHLLRLTGKYGSDVVPFHRYELIRFRMQ